MCPHVLQSRSECVAKRHFMRPYKTGRYAVFALFGTNVYIHHHATSAAREAWSSLLADSSEWMVLGLAERH